MGGSDRVSLTHGRKIFARSVSDWVRINGH